MLCCVVLCCVVLWCGNGWNPREGIPGRVMEWQSAGTVLLLLCALCSGSVSGALHEAPEIHSRYGDFLPPIHGLYCSGSPASRRVPYPPMLEGPERTTLFQQQATPHSCHSHISHHRAASADRVGEFDPLDELDQLCLSLHTCNSMSTEVVRILVYIQVCRDMA